MANVSLSFLTKKAFLLSLAKTLARLDADMDRWHAIQEALRMAAPCIPSFEDRAAMSKWSLLLCVACQTNLEQKIPECFGETDDSISLRCCAPHTDFVTIGSLRKHQEEFAQGAREIGLILGSLPREHCSAGSWDELARAKHLLECLADELVKRNAADVNRCARAS